MTDLSTLAERLEKAIGPDPALDAMIACALHPEFADYEPSEDPQYGGGVAQRRGCPGWTKAAPPYTSRIDAALALVEAKLPGWTGRLTFTGWQIYAELMPDGTDGFHQSKAPTAPLAILSALVAALAAQEEQS